MERDTQIAISQHQNREQFKGKLVWVEFERDHAIVGIAAIVLVFVLSLILYERVRVAAAILLIPALAVAAGLVALRITGTELNISSMTAG